MRGLFYFQRNSTILNMFKFFKSFKYALQGFITLAKTERNFKIILVIMIITLLTGFGLDYFGQHLLRHEWAIIWLAIGLMLVSEAMNTALEKTLDTLHPDNHPGIGLAKDMAAGATLCASGVAIIVGLYILLPRILAIF